MNTQSKCSICGRSLTRPSSIEAGTGPICRVTVKNQVVKDGMENIFTNRCEYSYTLKDSVISITDLGGMKSVTNDIENVLTDIIIAEIGIDLDDYKIMYRDSQKIWDGIRFENGCVAFFSLGCTKEAAAREKLLRKVETKGKEV